MEALEVLVHTLSLFLEKALTQIIRPQSKSDNTYHYNGTVRRHGGQGRFAHCAARFEYNYRCPSFR